MLSTSRPEPGTTIAGFRLERVIDCGRTGVVYQATRGSDGEVVALKVLTPALADSEGFRARFRREASLQARLDHPHVVPILDAGDADGALFIAMPLIPGGSLKNLIVARELDLDRVFTLLRPVASALTAAHAAGLVHRDLRPQNILIGHRDHAYLADFGLTATRASADLTRPGGFAGSADYASPERIRGEPATDRGDIYAFAAVLFESITGAVPYPLASDAAVLHAHLASPPPRVTEVRPELARALNAVFATAMAKDPADRPATADEVIDSAQRAAGRSTSEAGSFPPPSRRTDDPRVRPSEAGVDAIPATPRVAGPTALAGAGSPAPERAPSGGRSRRDSALAAALLVVTAVAAGGALGVAQSDSGSLPPPRIAAGSLTIEAPGGWRLPGTASRIAGLPLTDAEQLDDNLGGSIVVGMLTDAGGRFLLPPALARTEPTGDVVAFGPVAAYRYGDLRVPGAPGGLTLYVTPTRAGVAAIACLAPPGGSGTFAASCRTVASTARVRGTSSLPLGPDPAYGKRVDRALATARAPTTRRALGRARTARGQGRLLDALSRAQTRAAAELKDAGPGPDAAVPASRLRSAFRSLAADLAAMADAARRGDRARYARRAARARAERQRLADALQTLAAAGYRTDGRSKREP